MKRQRVKFPWDFYWENKIYKLKRSIPMFSKSFGACGSEKLIKSVGWTLIDLCVFDDNENASFCIRVDRA